MTGRRSTRSKRRKENLVKRQSHNDQRGKAPQVSEGSHSVIRGVKERRAGVH